MHNGVWLCFTCNSFKCEGNYPLRAESIGLLHACAHAWFNSSPTGLQIRSYAAPTLRTLLGISCAAAVLLASVAGARRRPRGAPHANLLR